MLFGNKLHEIDKQDRYSALGKQPAVAKEPANKQSRDKRRLGWVVNQPEGTRAQSLKHREPVSQGRPSQVSSSVKYQQLIVYLFPPLSLSPPIPLFLVTHSSLSLSSYETGQRPQIIFLRYFIFLWKLFGQSFLFFNVIYKSIYWNAILFSTVHAFIKIFWGVNFLVFNLKQTFAQQV